MSNRMFWSCSSNLFACSAILCWDYLNFSYSFSNVTDCSPKSLDFLSDKRLVPIQQNVSLNESKSFANGFLCSRCTRSHFVKVSPVRQSRCKYFPTRIQLESFCSHFYRDRDRDRNETDQCQCSPSARRIDRVHEWNRLAIESGKSNLNPRKSQEINGSSLSSTYVLFGLLLFIVIFGGFVGLVSFHVQSKRRKNNNQ